MDTPGWTIGRIAWTARAAERLAGRYGASRRTARAFAGLAVVMVRNGWRVRATLEELEGVLVAAFGRQEVRVASL